MKYPVAIFGVVLACFFGMGTAFSAEEKKPKATKAVAKAKKPDHLAHLTGDLSHRFLVKTRSETQTAAGKKTATIKHLFVERIRLQLEQRFNRWGYVVGLSTLDNSRLSASLVPLSKDTDHVLKIRDFQFVNLYAEYQAPDGLKLRFGRTQHSLLKYKSEMLWDNDIYFDGIWAEGKCGLARDTRWHGGAFQIHHDLRFRGDKVFAMGLLGTPKVGKTQYEWRVTHYGYGLRDPMNNGWFRSTAPDYKTLNIYGAIETPRQIRFTLDLARNFSADAPGAMHNGGDALNATLVLGKMKKNGNFQLIEQYIKVGEHAVPGGLVCYEKRLNMQGMQTDVKYRLTKNTNLQFMFINWNRLEDAVRVSGKPTDPSYKRWELSINHSF